MMPIAKLNAERTFRPFSTSMSAKTMKNPATTSKLPQIELARKGKGEKMYRYKAAQLLRYLKISSPVAKWKIVGMAFYARALSPSTSIAAAIRYA